MTRLINCGFFNLDDTYINALKKLDLCKDTDFSTIRRNTYLPIIRDDFAPAEVYRLVKAAVENSNPQKGDVVLVSGSPDVVVYIVEMLNGSGATLLCPMGRSRNGVFHLRGFREIVRGSSGNQDSLDRGLMCLIEESGGAIHGSNDLRKEGVRPV